MKMKYLDFIFYPPPGEVGVIASPRMSGGLSVFRLGSRSQKPMGDFFHIAHTQPYLNGRPSAIINFNMPDIWQRFFSKTDLGNPWVDFFHIAHTHTLGDVDVSFEVNEL